MLFDTIRILPTAVAAIVLSACAKAPGNGTSDSASAGPPAASRAAITGHEWTLVTLRDSAAPPGAGGRAATIRFDSTAARAAGFAGCNQYSAQYTMSGDSLHFGPAISTKMACAEGDSLERVFLAIIPDVTTFQATDSTLTLAGSSGPLAGFRAQ